MDIQGFFTQKGLLLAAKLAAGATLHYTRACAGAAETALSASALSQIRQTLSMGRPRRNGGTAVLPVTLEAGMAGSAYTLREVGLYAQDPDEGEILYKVYRLSEPVGVNPSSRLVLRFYLEETVSQDLNVTVVRASAGLLTEADLDPLRARVEPLCAKLEQAAETWTSKTVEAADLPAYINSLPRLLTTNLTVTVKGGTVAGILAVRGFYGPGTLTIKAKENEEVVCQGQVSVKNCGLYVELKGLKLRPAAGGPGIGVDASVLTASDCAVSWPEAGNSTSGAFASCGSALTLFRCELRGCEYALNAQSGGVITAHNCAGSGNHFGSMATMGGTVLLGGTTPDLMGGNANTKGGGMIVKADGTLL